MRFQLDQIKYQNFSLYIFHMVTRSFLSTQTVVRSSVPKLNLDDVFEQKNDIAKAVEDELEKVNRVSSPPQ